MHDETKQNRRSRRLVWLLLGAAVAALGVAALLVPFGRWATAQRQSGVRGMVRAALASVAQAAEVYAADTGTPPTLDDLIAAGLVDTGSLAGFSRCAGAASGGPPALDAWLVQTVPCRAVRRGEPWNGPGETIDRDLPACRFVLMKDWSVREIDEPDFQRDFAGGLRLSPVE